MADKFLGLLLLFMCASRTNSCDFEQLSILGLQWVHKRSPSLSTMKAGPAWYWTSRNHPSHVPSASLSHDCETDMFNHGHGRKQCVRHIGPPTCSQWLDGAFAGSPFRPAFGDSPVQSVYSTPAIQQDDTGDHVNGVPSSPTQRHSTDPEPASTWSSQSPPHASPEQRRPPSLAEPFSDSEESGSLRQDSPNHEVHGAATGAVVVHGQGHQVAIPGRSGPGALLAASLNPDSEPFVPTGSSSDRFTQPDCPRENIRTNQHGPQIGPHLALVPRCRSREVLTTTPPPASLQNYICSLPLPQGRGHASSLFHNTELELMHHHLPFEHIPLRFTMSPPASLPVSPDHGLMMTSHRGSSSASSISSVSLSDDDTKSNAFRENECYQAQNEELAALVKDSIPLPLHSLEKTVPPAATLEYPRLQALNPWVPSSSHPTSTIEPSFVPVSAALMAPRRQYQFFNPINGFIPGYVPPCGMRPPPGLFPIAYTNGISCHCIQDAEVSSSAPRQVLATFHTNGGWRPAAPGTFTTSRFGAIGEHLAPSNVPQNHICAGQAGEVPLRGWMG
ncbi:hypothetical protein A1O1_08327 [Capronia coronata CBS 617.96]|uniref:Uncharacterized protein n=1 Tax=Capronia coronata CBS 617.96 TaxID=1182541 RepID=W9XS65_9EURO|nr:uncharacterized protein A1O1_08327 [Capronia coronata CBS 617.96]EXJ80185.1 hypothetical protein A1O1_08327 [Capronia coronata CBS 617.96]